MKLNSKYGGVFFKNCIQKSLSLLFSLLVSAYAFAQTNFKTDSTGIVADTLTNDTIYSFAEVMPQYPGGDHALQASILKNVRWPKELNPAEIPPSTFYLSWVVEKDGTVSQPQVKASSPLHDDIKKSLIDAITTLNGFVPGKTKGAPVRVKLQCPLKIHWQN